MRERELRAAAKCAFCGKGFMESGLPLFYRVRIQRFGVDMSAVRRQSGFEQMLGGAAALARVMGPDEEMAKPLHSVEFTVCETCSLDFDRGSMPVACMAELALEQQPSADEVSE